MASKYSLGLGEPLSPIRSSRRTAGKPPCLSQSPRLLVVAAQGGSSGRGGRRALGKVETSLGREAGRAEAAAQLALHFVVDPADAAALHRTHDLACHAERGDGHRYRD